VFVVIYTYKNIFICRSQWQSTRSLKPWLTPRACAPCGCSRRWNWPLANWHKCSAKASRASRVLRATKVSDDSAPLLSALDHLLAVAEQENPEFAKTCADDRRKLAAIRSAREVNAEDYFARHAEQWDELRALHTPDVQVEEQLAKALSTAPLGALLDIGTGTGRMAELFAGEAERITAFDKNLEMLRVARAKLQHLPTAQIELVQGDFSDLPFEASSFDTVLLHQVLHFAQDPALPLAEAARVTSPGGRIAIIDFAAHDHEELRDRHQHARLGFSDSQMHALMGEAGFAPSDPITLEGSELIVKIWIGTRGQALHNPPSEYQTTAPKKATL